MNYSIQSEHSNMSSLVAKMISNYWKTTGNAHKRLNNSIESFYYIVHLSFPL